jgi:uncharacterized protein YtpQ (UPF0354 family)
MTDQERQIEEVLELLKQGSHGRDSIALLAVKLIEIRNPDKRIEFESESEIKVIAADGKSGSMSFLNLWIECERSPEQRAEIVDRYIRVLFSAGSDRPELSTKSVMVLVRDIQYCNSIAKEERDLVTDHLLGDLWVILAVDLAESINILSAEKHASLGLEKKELIRLGIENVERIVGRMEFSPYGECFTLACESIDYASSVLLLDSVWDQAANLIAGDLVVAVPARDTVLFTGSANAKGLKEIREAANYVTSTGHHLVTETLMKRVDRGWKLFS